MESEKKRSVKTVTKQSEIVWVVVQFVLDGVLSLLKGDQVTSLEGHCTAQDGSIEEGALCIAPYAGQDYEAKVLYKSTNKEECMKKKQKEETKKKTSSQNTTKESCTKKKQKEVKKNPSQTTSNKKSTSCDEPGVASEKRQKLEQQKADKLLLREVAFQQKEALLEELRGQLSDSDIDEVSIDSSLDSSLDESMEDFSKELLEVAPSSINDKGHPTTAQKQPRPQVGCAACASMQEENKQLRKRIVDLMEEVSTLKTEKAKLVGKQSTSKGESCLSRPNAGLCTPQEVELFGMLEVNPGSGLFVHPDQMMIIKRKVATGDGRKLARTLLGIFFSNEQLASGSLSPTGNYQQLDQNIIRQIKITCTSQTLTKPGDVHTAMRSVLTSKRAKAKKWKTI
ncbi:uncharacterized protein LOC106181235 [Lingula anatina]|uniref:Uncharacterized protein LOC106181235 n=1 Tax=Lingula anatina TaxID=7574 RepID=A0A1S3KET5_LINAN|nr:uncharacterized protein LOC106181235 [Lingula anatina]|eukprot:XP_013421012.1 uncharacterized protein LOC106181235 [Lingula anatina]